MVDPLVVPIPESFETARLVLRSPRPGDGQALFEAVAESITELRQFPASLPWAMAEPTAEASEAYCRSGFAEFVARKDLPFLLFERSGGRLVGGSGLHRFDWKVPKFEIGFWCRTSAAGRGYITEAVRGLTALAMTTLHARRIAIVTDEGNIRASRVCERTGYVLEGTLRNERIDPDGMLRNTRIYARVPPAPTMAEPMFRIREIDHLVLRVVDPHRMLRFYCEVLGCRIERRQESLGLVQLRAGRCLLDLVAVEGKLGRAGGAAPGKGARNLDHFCLRVDPFDEAGMRRHLEAQGIEVGPVASRYGAEGEGPSVYITDPEGNVVELKGPPDG